MGKRRCFSQLSWKKAGSSKNGRISVLWCLCKRFGDDVRDWVQSEGNEKVVKGWVAAFSSTFKEEILNVWGVFLFMLGCKNFPAWLKCLCQPEAAYPEPEGAVWRKTGLIECYTEVLMLNGVLLWGLFLFMLRCQNFLADWSILGSLSGTWRAVRGKIRLMIIHGFSYYVNCL